MNCISTVDSINAIEENPMALLCLQVSTQFGNDVCDQVWSIWSRNLYTSFGILVKRPQVEKA